MNPSNVESFRKLHHQDEPLLLGNVWDVPSAKTFEKLGIGTSSAAIALMMGYEDSQEIPFPTYVMIIERIISQVEIPLSVDIEAGFGDSTSEVIENILRLSDLGVVGINLEDSIVSDGKRMLVDAEEFTKKLATIASTLKTAGVDIFINLRSDAYLLDLSEPLSISQRRISLYCDHVDGIFLPGLTSQKDIRSITESIHLPLNVMTMPGLPGFEALKRLGIKRLSMGNFMQTYLMKQMVLACEDVRNNQDSSVML